MHSHLHDAITLSGFVLGIALFLMKRAGMAMRAKTNPLKSRAEYFKLNWDIFLYRGAFEAVVLWFPFAHYKLADLVGLFGMQIQLPVEIPVNFASCFGLGLAADFFVDWIAVYERTPGWIKKFMQEQLPPLNDTGKSAGGG